VDLRRKKTETREPVNPVTSILFLGLLIGMRHALEADHVAAVASLAANTQSVRQTVRIGAVWGVGHTMTLFLLGGLVLWFDTAIPERLAQGLEFAVGVMLVLLGLDVLRRVLSHRIHFHLHRHTDGHTHFHAHSHHGEREPHDAGAHHHTHPQRFPVRALMVGMMHGMAGTAALLLLALHTAQSTFQGILYILVFGAGSIIGMALLSLAIAIPLRHSARSLAWTHNGLQTGIGILTVSLGCLVMYESAAAGLL